jgi:hypothetical protein
VVCLKCDREASIIRRPRPQGAFQALGKKKTVIIWRSSTLTNIFYSFTAPTQLGLLLSYGSHMDQRWCLNTSTSYCRHNFDIRMFVISAWYIHSLRHAVAQLVEALSYKPEGRGFDSRWCYWNFSLT